MPINKQLENKTILVVGGAGYIGSHMVQMLFENNYQVVVLDNLSTGYADAVLEGTFIQGDLSDTQLLNDIFDQYKIDAVMHFASFIQVGESVLDPKKYYENNLVKTIQLLNAMVKHHINYFIFSSSAAVYGDPQYTPIDEGHPTRPINPYGQTKLMVEQILRDYEVAYQLHSVCLRYFNAAGAHPEGLLGERHDPESHLIPLVLQVASGNRRDIKIYGDDYNTPDGTCIRDYVHIMDLCSAHLLALEYLSQYQKSDVFNLGNHSGFSVREVIQVAEAVTRKNITVDMAPRRAGDAPILIADATKAHKILNWQPYYPKLDDIIQHAWVWEQKQRGLL